MECSVSAEISPASVQLYKSRAQPLGGGLKGEGPDSPKKVGRTTPTFYVAVHETGYTIRILFCTIT